MIWGEGALCVPASPERTVGARVAHQMAEELCGISREHLDVEDRQRCGKFPLSVNSFSFMKKGLERRL